MISLGKTLGSFYLHFRKKSVIFQVTAAYSIFEPLFEKRLRDNKF